MVRRKLYKKILLSPIYDFVKKVIQQTEVKTLEWDILNPDYLIWVFNGHTFDFLIKTFFLKVESLSRF